jgi:hypothetical protein
MPESHCYSSAQSGDTLQLDSWMKLEGEGNKSRIRMTKGCLNVYDVDILEGSAGYISIPFFYGKYTLQIREHYTLRVDASVDFSCLEKPYFSCKRQSDGYKTCLNVTVRVATYNQDYS